MPLSVQCTNEEKVHIVATPLTSTGRPATFDGQLRVSVQSGDGTAEIGPAADFHAVSGDAPGDTVFLVEADVDLGEGETLIQDTVTLTVTGAHAASFGLSAQPPQPK